MIEVSSLSREFIVPAEKNAGKSNRGQVPKLAVDSATFSVEPGEVFALLGPNGAGKTTLLRMIAALLKPTSGEAHVCGFSVRTQSEEIHRRIGILTESPGLYARLSGRENLAFHADVYDLKDAKGRIENWLNRLGLKDHADKPTHSYSKGMRQKLALIRALLPEPEVVLLDEPTSALDPESAQTVREVVQELQTKKRTVILCTHNLDEAEKLAHRVAVFRQRILFLGTQQEMRKQLFGERVIVELGSPSAREATLALGDLNFACEILDPQTFSFSTEDRFIEVPKAISLLVQQGYAIVEVRRDAARLEEAYLKLVQARDEMEPSRQLASSTESTIGSTML